MKRRKKSKGKALAKPPRIIACPLTNSFLLDDLPIGISVRDSHSNYLESLELNCLRYGSRKKES